MSITEVSKLAGVSTATVSRVINNYPYVSDRVVRAVRDAMTQLDYQPRKGSGRKPSSRRSAMRNMVTPDASGRKLAIFALIIPEVRTSFYPTIIQSFDEAADEHAHQILTCCTHNDVGKQGDVILQLIDHHVAGVVLVPTTHGMPPVHHLRQLQSHQIPVVLWHRPVPGIAAPLVELDFEGVTRLAGRCIAEAGHRRVAMFLPHKGQGHEQFILGLQNALHDHGGECPDELIHFGERPRVPSAYDAHYRKGVESALQRMLSLPQTQRPTAIYCSWDPLAELIYLSLEKLGYQVPGDVSLVSTGGTWRGGAMASRCTAVTMDEDQAGRWAADLLYEMSTGRRPLHDEYRVMIPVKWHAGQTLAEMESSGGARRRKARPEAARLAASA